MLKWDKPLEVGNTDRYSVTPSDKWLDGETLVSATVSLPNNTIATATAGEITAGVVSALFTGVAAGYVEVDLRWETATRSDCAKVMLRVKDC